MGNATEGVIGACRQAGVRSQERDAPDQIGTPMHPDYMFAMAVIQDRLRYAETQRMARPRRERPARPHRVRTRVLFLRRAGEGA
jgi:hypothetical protein